MSLDKWRDKYIGKRVFVIGNGPSLKDTPLDLIKDEYSIGMNRISRIYGETSWRPSFFLCTTENIQFSDWKRDILSSVNLGIPSFIWDKLSPHVHDAENIELINCFHGDRVCSHPPLDWWSNDIEFGVSKFGTSMLVAFQIVMFMGFSEIVILGADLNFTTSVLQKLFTRLKLQRIANTFDKNHFFGSYGTPGASHEILNINMLGAHRLTLAAAKKNSVAVYNATVGGNLEVYPRVNIEDILSSKSPIPVGRGDN